MPLDTVCPGHVDDSASTPGRMHAQRTGLAAMIRARPPRRPDPPGAGSLDRPLPRRARPDLAGSPRLPLRRHRGPASDRRAHRAAPAPWCPRPGRLDYQARLRRPRPSGEPVLLPPRKTDRHAGRRPRLDPTRAVHAALDRQSTRTNAARPSWPRRLARSPVVRPRSIETSWPNGSRASTNLGPRSHKEQP